MSPAPPFAARRCLAPPPALAVAGPTCPAVPCRLYHRYTGCKAPNRIPMTNSRRHFFRGQLVLLGVERLFGGLFPRGGMWLLTLRGGRDILSASEQPSEHIRSL